MLKILSKIRKKRKRRKTQKSSFDFTINQALIFSVTMVITFTIVMIITFYKFQSVPDSLVAGFFAMFGLEGGYCAFLHKLKKERENEMKSVRVGDITGFDDAEVIDMPNEPDEPDDGDLVIDVEGEN